MITCQAILHKQVQAYTWGSQAQAMPYSCGEICTANIIALKACSNGILAIEKKNELT